MHPLGIHLCLEGVFLDELAAGFDDVAHEFGEHLVGGVGAYASTSLAISPRRFASSPSKLSIIAGMNVSRSIRSSTSE